MKAALPIYFQLCTYILPDFDEYDIKNNIIAKFDIIKGRILFKNIRGNYVYYKINTD